MADYVLNASRSTAVIDAELAGVEHGIAYSGHRDR